MNKKGQTLLEYAILIIIILAVFIAMQAYVKRGIQGRWKASVDSLGDQYDPRFANSFTNYATNSTANSLVYIVPVDGGFVTQRQDTTNSTESKAGQTTIGSVLANTF